MLLKYLHPYRDFHGGSSFLGCFIWMTFVRIRDYSALNGSSWFLLFRSCRNGALRIFPASGASSFDHLCYLRGYITAAQTNLLIPSCLQFPDIFKSRTAVLVRITFYSSGYPNWQGTGGAFCLPPEASGLLGQSNAGSANFTAHHFWSGPASALRMRLLKSLE